MSGLAGRHAETFTVEAAPDAVRAALSDPARIIAATDLVQAATPLGDGVIHFVLQPQGAAGVTFQPDYRVRWTVDGQGVRWEPVEPSNLLNRGSARIEAAGAGSRVVWEQEITLRVSIPRLMMTVVQPVIDRTLTPSLRTYVSRLRAGL